MVQKTHRDAIKVFEDAGFAVTIKSGRRHFQLLLDGQVVHTMSQGPKQSRRADADLRRKVRRLQEGRSLSTDKRPTHY